MSRLTPTPLKNDLGAGGQAEVPGEVDEGEPECDRRDDPSPLSLCLFSMWENI